jgi:hypothetical protein
MAETEGETTHRSPRRGSSRRFQLEEVVEGVGAMVLPQASVAEATGVGRNGRATAAAIEGSPELARKRGGERGLGWVG